MKTKIINIVCVAIAVLCFSCSSDSENNNQTDMSLNKTVEFLPQEIGFTSRIVTHFENNKRVNDTTYNNAGAVTSRKEYTYTSNTTTTLGYDAQNVLTFKYVDTYDTAKRITNIDQYNGQNQLTYSKEYQYAGHDINVFITTTGTPVLIAKFKTNSDNLLNYQSSAVDDDIRMMTYSNDKPAHMDYGGTTTAFEFYPNMKPQNLQNSVNEINNTALLVVLDHVYFSCNYYLKTVNFPTINTTTHYDKTFNENNYQTYMNTYIDYNGTLQNGSEMFFYYQ